MDDRDGLSLDLERHIYRFDGQRVGGVSEILAAAGLVDARWFTEESRARGNAVHRAIELHLTGTLDEATVDPRIRGYFDAALAFLRDAGVSPGARPITECVEQPVYHRVYRYAGMPDLIAQAFGVECVIDWKSGAIGMAGLATAAYEMADRATRGLKNIRRRMAVQLKPDGRYTKTDLIDPYDYSHFLAAAGLFNAFHLHRRKEHTDGIPEAS